MDEFIAEHPDSSIVGIWMDCGAWLADVDRLVRAGYDLCYKLGVELGDFEGTWDDRITDRIPVVHSTPYTGPDVLDDWSEHTEPTINFRIGVGADEQRLSLPLSALDADEPPEDAEPEPATSSTGPGLEPVPEPTASPAMSGKRWLAVGLVGGMALATLAFTLWPTPSRQGDVAEPLTQPIPSRPSVSIETPQHRKASTVQFVKDTDTVIVKRKNKPSLRITVVEEKETDKPTTAPGAPTHEVDWDAMGGMGMEVGIDGGDIRVILEGNE